MKNTKMIMALSVTPDLTTNPACFASLGVKRYMFIIGLSRQSENIMRSICKLISVTMVIVLSLQGCTSLRSVSEEKSIEDFSANINPGEELIVLLKNGTKSLVVVKDVDSEKIVSKQDQVILLKDVEDIQREEKDALKTTAAVTLGVVGTVVTLGYLWLWVIFSGF